MFFEIVLSGFDGGTDETDDQILWVKSTWGIDYVRSQYPDADFIVKLDFEVDKDDLDRDLDNGPRWELLVKQLLDCPDLNTDYLDEKTIEVISEIRYILTAFDKLREQAR